MFHSLRHRNFRLYLSGQFVSVIGTWMQQLATSWLVYRLTQSTLWLGISAFSSMIPTFVLGLFAGVYVDRANRHRLLIWTQSLSAIQALILAVLTLTGRANLTELIVLNLALGMINAVDMPARQAFVVEMIADRKDLPNAIALNSSVMNGTRLIGPAIAGAMIAVVGEGMCFLLNSLSYLAVLGALLQMKIVALPRSAHKETLKQSLRIGFHSAFSFHPIRAVLLFLAFMSFFGGSYSTLFPALAAQALNGGAGALGAITSAAGLGALTGALYLARRQNVMHLGRVLGKCALIFSVSLIAVSRTHQFGWMLASLYMTGLGLMVQLGAGNTVIQTLVEDDKRGRIMSFFTFALLGVAPFGSLLTGWAAQEFGLSTTLLISGLICAAGSMVFLSRIQRLNLSAPGSVF